MFWLSELNSELLGKNESCKNLSKKTTTTHDWAEKTLCKDILYYSLTKDTFEREKKQKKKNRGIPVTIANAKSSAIISFAFMGENTQHTQIYYV